MSTEIKINELEQNEYKITALPQGTKDQLYLELIDWYTKLIAVSFSISPDDLRKNLMEWIRKNTITS